MQAARRMGLRYAGPLWLLAFAVAAASAQERSPADLVLRGGKVVTMEADQPAAAAVAVRDAKIVAVGSLAEVNRLVGSTTRVVELNGRTVTPGFIEGHGHFVSLGTAKMQLELSATRSWDEVVALVAAAANKTPQGQWIVGRGWHQSKWQQPPDDAVDGYPVHTALSRAAPRHPVMLTHASGHMCLANAAAMRLAGVDEDTRDRPGGETLRDRAGRPTGVFRENAMGPIRRAYSRYLARRSDEQVRKELLTAIKLAGDECLRHGVTSFQDAGSSFATIDVFRELARQKRLPVRLWVMANEDHDALVRFLPRYRMIGFGEHHLTVRAVKRLIDGALGTHGAWLLAPYDDLSTSRGLNTMPVNDLRETCRLARGLDVQMCVHAIGDKANRVVLDVFEEVLGKPPAARQARWRVEHAQHLDPIDIPRFGRLGVIASMQAVHCTSDAPFVLRRLGMRRAAQGAYAWRSLIDSGAVVVNGSDVPVEPIDPLAGLHASVTRQLADGTAFFPEQKMTRREALLSYTLNPAYAAFEEKIKGSIQVGKLADLVVLTHDPLKVPADKLRAIQVDLTIVHGEVRYRRAD